jgi:hypothetical protein
MERAGSVAAEEWFAEHPEALPVYLRVRELLEPVGPYDVRVTKSQVTFRRRRGFAYLWLPGMYVANDVVVVSVALGRRIDSDRLKEVVQPRPGLWMHHLEVHDLDDLDDEVAGWLGEAADVAA